MSNAQRTAVETVAAELFEAETSLDAVITRLARLPGSINAASAEASLQFGTTQGSLSDSVEAMTYVVKARHHVARLHERLREVGDKHDLIAHGDIFPCPGDEKPPSGELDDKPLTLVRAA